jgi:hypothetical protein
MPMIEVRVLDTMASLLAPYASDAALGVATALDAKVESVLPSAAGMMHA